MPKKHTMRQPTKISPVANQEFDGAKKKGPIPTPASAEVIASLSDSAKKDFIDEVMEKLGPNAAATASELIQQESAKDLTLDGLWYEMMESLGKDAAARARAMSSARCTS